MVLNTTDLIFITYAMVRASNGISDSDIDGMAAISTFRTMLPSVHVLVARLLLDLRVQEAHQREVVVLGSTGTPLDISDFTPTCANDGASRSPSLLALAPALGALGATLIEQADCDLLGGEENLSDAPSWQATRAVPLPEWPHRITPGSPPRIRRRDVDCEVVELSLSMATTSGWSPEPGVPDHDEGDFYAV